MPIGRRKRGRGFRGAFSRPRDRTQINVVALRGRRGPNAAAVVLKNARSSSGLAMARNCGVLRFHSSSASQRAVMATLIGPAAALPAPSHGDREPGEPATKEAAGHGGPQPAILPPTPGAGAAPLAAPVDAARRVN